MYGKGIKNEYETRNSRVKRLEISETCSKSPRQRKTHIHTQTRTQNSQNNKRLLYFDLKYKCCHQHQSDHFLWSVFKKKKQSPSVIFTTVEKQST